MKVSLKGLPDEPRGGAWPSSARTVRRALKCVNERDPRPMLLLLAKLGGTHGGLPAISGRKEWATVDKQKALKPAFTTFDE